MGLELKQCTTQLSNRGSVENVEELETQTLAKANDANQTKPNKVITLGRETYRLAAKHYGMIQR